MAWIGAAISAGAGLLGGAMGGNDDDKTATQTNEPWGPLQPYLQKLYGNTASQMGTPMNYFPYRDYAYRSPMTNAGQQALTQYATNVLPQMFQGGYGALQSMLQSPDVAANPYVNRMLEVQAGQVGDQLMRNWLPSIRTGAQQAGQYGGTRQGIAEGLALGEAAKALNSGAAQTQLGAYGQGLDQQARGMQEMQMLADLGMAPAQIFGNVGGQQEAYNQKVIDANKARWDYTNMEPWQRLQMANQIFNSGSPYGTQTTTAQSGSSPFATGIGTALSVYGAGDEFGWWNSLGNMFNNSNPYSGAASSAVGFIP